MEEKTLLSKKILLLSIILVSLLAISSVSAVENITSDSIALSDDNAEEVLSTDEPITYTPDENIVESTGENDEIGKLSELYASIQSTPSGGALNLTKNYQASNDYQMRIDKSITVNGNGHEINGNNHNVFFVFESGNITLKNIKFKNCIPDVYENGFLTFEEGNCVVDNCSFENISNDYFSANCEIIKFKMKNNEVTNCRFINSTATSIGGGHDTKIDNCTFINNSHRDILSFYEGFSRISNCHFINNTARAIYSPTGKNEIINCAFINNKHVDSTLYMKYGKIINSKFNSLSEINDMSLLELYNVTFYNNEVDSIAFTKSSDEESLNLMFFDANGAALKNKPVKISINNENYTFYTHNNGFLRLHNNLSLGNNNIEIINPYTTESIKTSIFIKKHKIECEDLIANYTENEYYTIRVTDNSGNPVANAKVTLKINGDEYTLVSDTQGYSSLKLSINGWDTEYDENLHIIILKSFGKIGMSEMNIEYEGDSVSRMLIINPLDAKISLPDSEISLGESILLVAQVSKEYEAPNDYSSRIEFYDGETLIGEAEAYTNVGILNYTPLNSGVHKITAVFISEYYIRSNCTATLTIPKDEVELIINDIGTVYSTDQVNISVNVMFNSESVKEGTLNYYINDQLIGTSMIENGMGTFNYTANVTGLVNLTVIYEGMGDYLPSNASASFQVYKMLTSFKVDSVVFDDSDNKTFTVKLNDINGKGIANQNIKLEAVKYSGESTTLNEVTDSNGFAVFDMNNIVGGMWYVLGTYEGNDQFNGSKFSDKFIVIRMTTTTIIESIQNPSKGKPIHFHANIRDKYGNPVRDGIVYYYLDGSTFGYVDLAKHEVKLMADAKNNMVSSPYTLENNIILASSDDSDLYLEYIPADAGSHTLSVIYEGTTVYISSNQTITFTVSENSNQDLKSPTSDSGKGSSKPVAKTTLTLKTVKVKKTAKKLVLQATLKQGKTLLKNKKIKFKFNGKTYNAKTNKKGVAQITIKKSVLKKLKVGKKVKYQASFGKITVKKTVKVKK